MTVADPQSFNRYSYVNNDPVNLTDPLGLMAGADQGYSGFGGWGGSPGFNDPHFGGPGIIENGWNGFPDRQEIQELQDEGDDENDSPYKDESTGENDGDGSSEGEVTVSAEINGPVTEDPAPAEGNSAPSSPTTATQHEPRKGPFIIENPTSWVGQKKLGDGDCVPLVQQTAGLPHTSKWREGRRVLGNLSIKPGTIIATFINGRYPSWKTGNHAAIYLAQDANGIWVVDQYKSINAIQRRYIRIKPEGTDRSNNARAFSVVFARIPHPINGR